MQYKDQVQDNLFVFFKKKKRISKKALIRRKKRKPWYSSKSSLLGAPFSAISNILVHTLAAKSCISWRVNHFPIFNSGSSFWVNKSWRSASLFIRAANSLHFCCAASYPLILSGFLSRALSHLMAWRNTFVLKKKKRKERKKDWVSE